jgi:hypothetical protein
MSRSRVALVASFVAAVMAGCSGGGGPAVPGSPTSAPSTTASAKPSHAPSAMPTAVATATATPTPTAPPSAVPLTETARSADSFVDAIGMNVHLGVTGPYQSSNYTTINTLLEGLGVRHLRDSAYGYADPALCSEELGLEAHGIRFDYTTVPSLPVSQLGAWTTCAGAALESYEGPNEYDIQHPASDTNWPATLRAYQQSLYTTVKSSAASANAPVLGPTFTTENAYETVGNLSTSLDYGNMHDGFSGFNPGTAGYGSGGYGSIAYNVMLAQFVAAQKPVIASETGYTTASMVDGVTPAIQAKYMPRLFFDFFNAGIARTYEYEFVDEPSYGGLQGSFGIVESTLTPKPAYTALQSLIGLLSDPGTAPAAQTVSYAIGGAPLDLRHTLLQKRDGSFYLALWREIESWDPNKQAPIVIAPVTITIELSAQPASLTAYAYDATQTLQPATLTPATTFTVTVGDSLTIVRVVPGTAPSASVTRRATRAIPFSNPIPTRR